MLVSCNGGGADGDGGNPPPLGATPGTGVTIYAFNSGTASPQNDGIKPIANVIKVGNTLYGMTVYGGASGPSPDDPSVNGSGTVFAIALPD